MYAVVYFVANTYFLVLFIHHDCKKSFQVMLLHLRCICLDVKLQLLRLLKGGEHRVSVGNSLNLSTSMISTSGQHKSFCNKTSKLSTTKVTPSTSHLLEEMGKRFNIWVDDQTEWNVPLSQLIIMEKVSCIFTHTRRKWRYARNIYN